MSPAGFLVIAVVAMVAGFVYNWLTPLITPKLPSTITSNIFLSSIATGVFILLAVAVAHFVGRMIAGKRAKMVG